MLSLLILHFSRSLTETSQNVLFRGAAGQKFLTRGSGRVIKVPLGSGRAGSDHLLNDFGSGRAGSALKISGNFGSKLEVFSKFSLSNG